MVRATDLSGGYSPREVGIDEDHVEALREVLDRLPPILVEHSTMRVIDGLHRLEAFRRAGRAQVEAIMFHGDQAEAFALAISANIRHGKPLNGRERQAAAVRLMRQSPDRSDRWVGEVCGLSHSTVAKLRRAVSVAGPILRTGRDGRRRPVDPRPGQLAVAKALTEAPTLTLREAAEVAGVAPSTAHRAKARSGEGDPGTTWLERTKVDPEGAAGYLHILTPGARDKVVEEFRSRARFWSQLADTLEGTSGTRNR